MKVQLVSMYGVLNTWRWGCPTVFSIVELVIYQNHNWSLGNDVALGIRTAPSSFVGMAGEAHEVWCWQGLETLKSCEALHTARKAVPPPSLWGPAEDGVSQDFQLQCSALAPGSASSGVFHGWIACVNPVLSSSKLFSPNERLACRCCIVWGLSLTMRLCGINPNRIWFLHRGFIWGFHKTSQKLYCYRVWGLQCCKHHTHVLRVNRNHPQIQVLFLSLT